MIKRLYGRIAREAWESLGYETFRERMREII